MRGYAYDRRDVTGRGLANAYAQTLGTIFSSGGEKPYEVELFVAEVGESPADDQVYRLTYDGQVADEHGFAVMGGAADVVAGHLREHYVEGAPLAGALYASPSRPWATARPTTGSSRPATSRWPSLDRTRSQPRKFLRLREPPGSSSCSGERGPGQADTAQPRTAAPRPAGRPPPGPTTRATPPTRSAAAPPRWRTRSPASPPPRRSRRWSRPPSRRSLRLREAEIGQQLQRQDAADAGRRVADGFRRRVHVARPEQPDELVAEMVAVEQDEDDQDHDDADGQQRMHQGRHEGRHAREIGTAALHAHRRRRRGPAVNARSRPSEATMDDETAERAAALRQVADVLDLLVKVGLVAGQAAGHLGELAS